jgi:CRISPR type III-B/RAMP module RAMP protein Cmr1
MPRIELSLEVISPMFLNGADPRQPEMRAASVRGQLRYWLRAIVGAQTDDLSQVWERESAVFGSTKQGSAVTVRVFPQDVPPKQVVFTSMLPHNPEKRDRSRQDAIKPEHKVSLELVTRPGMPIPEDAVHALKVWALLGGLGKRSRRMFGAFRLTGEVIPVYDTPSELGRHIKDTLIAAGCQTKTNRSAVPSFPTLHATHSVILVGRGEEDYLQAEKKLFDLLHKDYVNQRMFGFADYERQDRDLLRSLHGREKREFEDTLIRRRASLMIAQLRCVDQTLCPVFTFMRSQPTSISSTKEIDWAVINRFIGDVKKQFNAEAVWGSELK